MTLKYILGRSEIVDGIEIHPVKIKHYEEFMDCSHVLYISKDHFSKNEFSLLELLVLGLNDKSDEAITLLTKVLSIATHENVLFFAKNEKDFGFITESEKIINKYNYDEIRATIMKQNLMFEQKVYKDKRIQKFRDLVLEKRAKSSIKIEFEDMLSTVSVGASKHYWELEEYTIYQLKKDFNRVSKFKNYETGIALATAGAGSDNQPEHYAEHDDIFKSPYDLDTFTKSKDSASKLNSAIK